MLQSNNAEFYVYAKGHWNAHRLDMFLPIFSQGVSELKRCFWIAKYFDHMTGLLMLSL